MGRAMNKESRPQERLSLVFVTEHSLIVSKLLEAVGSATERCLNSDQFP